MNRDQLDAEQKRVFEIFERLEPRITRYMINLTKKEGPTVGLSVNCNIMTTLLTAAILIVEDGGGDVDDFLKQVMTITREKYEHARNNLSKKAH